MEKKNNKKIARFVYQISKRLERKLIEEAINAREKSFVPVSDSKVGVSVLTADGNIYSGSCVEFARSMTMHAEPFVLAQVLVNYICPKIRDLPEIQRQRKIKNGFKEIVAIVEVNSKGIPGCGTCRQYALELNPKMIFYGVKPDGKIIVKKPVSELYPNYYRSNDKFRL